MSVVIIIVRIIDIAIELEQIPFARYLPFGGRIENTFWGLGGESGTIFEKLRPVGI